MSDYYNHNDYLDEDIEFVYWGEDEDHSTVDEQKFKRKKSDKIDIKGEIYSWLKLILIALTVALCVNYFIIINSEVPTGSMEHTIHANSRMIGYRLAYLFSEPKTGDIIIFKYPDDEAQTYVKRVIGTPGDTVSVNNGVVYLNGEALKEDYVYFKGGEADPKGDYGEVTVPEGCYFVLGDNRNDSKDSRFWDTTSFVTKDEILGKAILSYYPDVYILK